MSTKIKQEDMIAVIEAAIEQVSKEDGYTPVAYHEPQDRTLQDLPVLNDHPGATCAVGGVEQGVWKVTGDFTLRDHWSVGYRCRTLVAATQGVSGYRQHLFARVMVLLNKKAVEMYPQRDDLHRVPNNNLEDLTSYGMKAAQRKRVLAVYHAVLGDMKAKVA
jgi:hypothetical protein